MSPSSNLDQPGKGKQRKHDSIHHSDRRQRFQKEGNLALIEAHAKREQFGNRTTLGPKRRLFSFRKAWEVSTGTGTRPAP